MNIIKMDVKEIKAGADWIHQNSERNKCLVLVNTVANFYVA